MSGKAKSRLKLLAKVMLVLGVVCGGAYWRWLVPVTVIPHTAWQGVVVAEVMGTGTLEARTKAAIGPEITGRIRSVAVDQGDRVTQGQKLVSLDDTELQRQVEIAESEVATAEAAVQRLQTEQVRARAVLDQARREHQRLESLVTRNSASSVEVDRANEALRIAEAELDRSESGILEGRRKLTSATKTLEYRRAMLAEATLEAPFDGLVVRRDRDPGDVAVPGTPTLSLVSLDELWVRAWVDETEMGRLQPDQPARVVFRSEPEHSYPGRVARLGKEADRETREFLVDVRVLELPEHWAVGQRAEVYIEVARKQDATILPAQLILWHDRRPGAFVEAGGRAEWRSLELGLRGREHVEVIAGLQPGAQVVTPVKQGTELKSGRRVEVP